MPLLPLHEDVWVHAAPQTMFGLHLGTRMTVVRLPGGDLWVHSPIPPDEALVDELRSLGRVRHVVAPNMFHHLYAGTMADAFDGALIHATPGLANKRKDLRIDAELSHDTPSEWAGTLDGFEVAGTRFGEFVFHHRPSNLLITSDLLQNYTSCSHWMTRQYLRAGGVYKKPGLERFLRIMFRDRKKARESIDAILALKFDGMVVAHGDVVNEGGCDLLASSYAWL